MLSYSALSQTSPRRLHFTLKSVTVIYKIYSTLFLTSLLDTAAQNGPNLSFLRADFCSFLWGRKFGLPFFLFISSHFHQHHDEILTFLEEIGFILHIYFSTTLLYIWDWIDLFEIYNFLYIYTTLLDIHIYRSGSCDHRPPPSLLTLLILLQTLIEKDRLPQPFFSPTNVWHLGKRRPDWKPPVTPTPPRNVRPTPGQNTQTTPEFNPLFTAENSQAVNKYTAAGDCVTNYAQETNSLEMEMYISEIDIIN